MVTTDTELKQYAAKSKFGGEIQDGGGSPARGTTEIASGVTYTNLFNTLDEDQNTDGRVRYAVIYIKNTDDATRSNVRFYFDPSTITDATDDEGTIEITKASRKNEYVFPSGATDTDADAGTVDTNETNPPKEANSSANYNSGNPDDAHRQAVTGFQAFANGSRYDTRARALSLGDLEANDFIALIIKQTYPASDSRRAQTAGMSWTVIGGVGPST